jgi:hypothetical protein
MTTIVCTKCSFHNGAEDDFCGSCGEFLEFVGQRLAEPAKEETVKEEPAPVTTIETPEVVIPEPELVPVETRPPVSETATPVKETPVPVSEPEQPAAIAPQQLPSRRRPTAAPTAPSVRPGDLICGQCRQGNDQQRRFCRSCGASLVGSVVSTPVRLPWWKRLFQRKKKVHLAGDRPMRRRSLVGRILKAVLGLAVIGGIIGLAGPWRSSVTDTFKKAKKNVAPKFDPVNPAKAEASSSLADHGPALAVDTGSNTWWAESAKGNGEGQRISVTFDKPVDLAKIGFAIGADGDQFLALPRPKDLHLSWQGGTHDLTVRDKPEFQSYDLTANGVVRLDIEIRSVYPGQKGTSAAISDIQFFRRR